MDSVPSRLPAIRRKSALAAVVAATAATAATMPAPAAAKPVRILLSGDSIVESLPTMERSGTDLASLVRTRLLASATGRRRGWVDGGSGFIPAHAACGSGRSGCLPSGLPLATPWSRIGTWSDAGGLFLPLESEGANGMFSRSSNQGAWASTAVRGDSISVLHAAEANAGTVRIVVDRAGATAAAITAGQRTVGPLSDAIGVFLPGQSISGAGIAPGTKVSAARTAGTLDGIACPCVKLDRPAAANSPSTQLTATGPDVRDLRFPTDGSSSAPQRRDITGLAWGTHSLAIGNDGGTLRLLGAIGERIGTRAPAIVVSRLGRAGALAGDDLAPNQRSALLLMRPTLTLDMRGLNDELAEVTLDRNPAASRSAFGEALAVRFSLARSSGGCVHLQHAPTTSVPTSVASAYSSLSRTTAAAHRCSWSDALSRVWSRSESARWTSDGKHPTAAGYARIASALASMIAARPELR